MYKTPPKVTPLTPESFLGRLLTIIQAEPVLVNISVEDNGITSWYPPVTRNIYFEKIKLAQRVKYINLKVMEITA